MSQPQQLPRRGDSRGRLDAIPKVPAALGHSEVSAAPWKYRRRWCIQGSCLDGYAEWSFDDNLVAVAYMHGIIHYPAIFLATSATDVLVVTFVAVVTEKP